MKNTLKINHKEGIITMDRTFAKNAENTMSVEYSHLQSVRRDYPTYTVARRTIRSNPHKECWKGLTYEYMKSYIATHEDDENRETVLGEFAEMRLISQCHSRAYRYPVIKQWFLSKYPEISEHGMPAAEMEPAVSDKVVPISKNQESQGEESAA